MWNLGCGGTGGLLLRLHSSGGHVAARAIPSRSCVVTEPTPEPQTLQDLGTALCRSAVLPALVVDAQGTVRFANPGARRLGWGADGSPVGAELRSLVPPEDAARVADLLRPDAPPRPVTLRLPGEDGAGSRALRLGAVPLDGGGVLLVPVDTPPPSPGAIRAVAHDLNNILLTVMTFTDLLHADAEPGSQTAADLREIKDASVRASALVQRLFAISEGRDAPPSPDV